VQQIYLAKHDLFILTDKKSSPARGSPTHGALAQQGGCGERGGGRRGGAELTGGDTVLVGGGVCSGRKGSGSRAWWWSTRHVSPDLERNEARVSSTEGGRKPERRTAAAAYRRG
jgi:hypothetical protein